MSDKAVQGDLSNSEKAKSLSRNKSRVLATMFFAVTFMSLGDASLSKGMKMAGGLTFRYVPGILHAVTGPYVLAGAGFLIMFLFLYLASLSWEELSYVLPLTAGSYVLVTLLAKFVLHEPVTLLRWCGTILVAAGVVLVART